MFNILLMLIVLIIYTITHINKQDNENSDKIFLFLVFFTLFIIVGFRSYESLSLAARTFIDFVRTWKF